MYEFELLKTFCAAAEARKSPLLELHSASQAFMDAAAGSSWRNNLPTTCGWPIPQSAQAPVCQRE
jgi:hypothetical protein